MIKIIRNKTNMEAFKGCKFLFYTEDFGGACYAKVRPKQFFAYLAAKWNMEKLLDR